MINYVAITFGQGDTHVVYIYVMIMVNEIIQSSYVTHESGSTLTNFVFS